MAKAKKTIAVYVVRRVGWEYNDEFNDRIADPTELNSIRSFSTPEKAEAYRQQFERETRGDQNPFDYGGDGSDLADYSTLSAEAFRDRMMAADLSMATPRRRSSVRFDYGEWYDSLHKPSDEQRHAVWDALDLVRLLEVVPMQVELEE